MTGQLDNDASKLNFNKIWCKIWPDIMFAKSLTGILISLAKKEPISTKIINQLNVGERPLGQNMLKILNLWYINPIKFIPINNEVVLYKFNTKDAVNTYAPGNIPKALPNPIVMNEK